MIGGIEKKVGRGIEVKGVWGGSLYFVVCEKLKLQSKGWRIRVGGFLW